MDIHNIAPGAAWADEIQKALQWADAVVAVMTNEALASENVKNEWDWCLVYRHKLGKALYLLKIDDCIVPMQYVRVNWIDFHAKGQSTGLKILQAWIDHLSQNIADLPSEPDEFQSYLEMLYAEIVEGLASVSRPPAGPKGCRNARSSADSSSQRQGADVAGLQRSE